jgi:glutamine synthetase
VISGRKLTTTTITHMAKYKLEYIWLDGYDPVSNLRGKTQIKEFKAFPKLAELPMWAFDGSSTRQAEGKSSDCILKPIAVYPDSTKKNGALVMCEVLLPGSNAPHPSNARATMLDDPGAWFGFEQEYFGKGSKNAADQVWMARYLLMRLCEKYGVDVNWHCKPLGKDVDWNGSGMHTNFSTEHIREVGGKKYFEKLMAAFDKFKNEHIAVYGPDNHLRLTGLHETQSIDKFNYGVANRGASLRVSQKFIDNGYRGYLEDRRPNSQGDPYKIAGRILQTIATVPLK